MIKKFDEYNKRIKDITNTSEIEDIVKLLKNEIQLSNGDLNIESLYCRLLNDCYLQIGGFITYDMISEIRSNVKMSNSESVCRKQYKTLVDPKNDFSATLLKVFVQYPNSEFVDKLSRISRYILTGKCVSENYIKTILRSKI